VDNYRKPKKKTKGDRVMAKLGNIELLAVKDVKKGEETKINALFTSSEYRKEFTLLEDMTRDKTGIKVTIAKVGSFDTKSDISRKKGEKTSCGALLKYADLSKNLKASDDIKKDDKLSVTIETI
jgi:hypothetical protein